MLQQQNRGLILFNKLSTAAATSQGPQYVDFYSQEEHSEIISDLNDLLKYQESHCHACDTSRLHDHYHCAATVGMPLIQFYHRPHPMEAVAEKDATEREMLALKRSTKLPFGPWEQKIFYDEDLEAQQENILTTWFNGFLFGPPTAVSNKRTFDYEEFFSQQATSDEFFYCALRITKLEELSKFSSNSRMLKISDCASQQQFYGCPFDLKKERTFSDVFLFQVKSPAVFEFSLYGKDSSNSAGKIRQIFKPLKNAISSMKDSQVSLKMSMKNLLVKKGLDSSLAQSKGSLAPSNHGNYSFAPLASTRIRVATEKKKNNYSEMLVQLEDDEGKVVANLWLDINLIPAIVANQPKEPAWDTLPSCQGFMNVYKKEDSMNGKLGYWHRYWVQCEQSKVSFYDFIYQKKKKKLHELDLNAFVACRTLSFDHCALEHSFSLVGPQGETTLVSLDDKNYYDTWFNTLEARLDAVSAIKAYNSNQCR